MKKLILSTMLVLPLSVSSLVLADEISDQITAGLEAYTEKDYKTALEELKFVTAQIEKLNSEENQKLLPEALEGWTLKETTDNGAQVAMAMFGGGGSSMKNEYKRDKEKVIIEVMANSPMMSVLSMMIKNPAMMAGQKNTTPFRYKKAKGMIKTKKNKTEMSLILAGQILIKLTGKSLKDDGVLKEYLKKIDFKKLKEALL
ncbi:MAG: hypothetical protein V3V19_08495 [Cocleimonas sp.]